MLWHRNFISTSFRIATGDLLRTESQNFDFAIQNTVSTFDR
jgi:hypothetical protein